MRRNAPAQPEQRETRGGERCSGILKERSKTWGMRLEKSIERGGKKFSRHTGASSLCEEMWDVQNPQGFQ